MTLALRNLSVLVYANGFTLWHYKSKDTLQRITTPRYCDDAVGMLSVGDMILVVGCDGATVRVVTTVDTDVVITAPLS